jgi:hypothetical protein
VPAQFPVHARPNVAAHRQRRPPSRFADNHIVALSRLPCAADGVPIGQVEQPRFAELTPVVSRASVTPSL